MAMRWWDKAKGAVEGWALGAYSKVMPWSAAEVWLQSFRSSRPLRLASLRGSSQAIALVLAPASMSDQAVDWAENLSNREMARGLANAFREACACNVLLKSSASKGPLAMLDAIGESARSETLMGEIAALTSDYFMWRAQTVASIVKRLESSIGAFSSDGPARQELRRSLALQIAEAHPGSAGVLLSLRAYLASPGSASLATPKIEQAFGSQSVERFCVLLEPHWLLMAGRMGARKVNEAVAAGSGAPIAPYMRDWRQAAEMAMFSAGALRGLAHGILLSLPASELGSWAKAETLGAVEPWVKKGLLSKSEPVVWAMAQENNVAGVLGLSMWGFGLDAAGPDGLRPVDIAVRKGRALLFRALVWSGADVSSKAPRARKTPIELGEKLLREDLGADLLAMAERESIKVSIAAHPERAQDEAKKTSPEDEPVEGPQDVARPRRHRL
jgi:hypothetical protein